MPQTADMAQAVGWMCTRCCAPRQPTCTSRSIVSSVAAPPAAVTLTASRSSASSATCTARNVGGISTDQPAGVREHPVSERLVDEPASLGQSQALG